MNLTWPELQLIAPELQDRLVNGIIQEVRQPSSSRIWFGIRCPGRTEGLLCEVSPESARIHLTSIRPSTLNPPPGFAARLRATVLGGRISAVSLPWSDRVIRVAMTTGSDPLALLIETSGHHSNCFLVTESNTILALLTPNSSHQRNLLPGNIYQPPLQPESGSPAPGTVRWSPDETPSAFLDHHFEAAEKQDSRIARHTAVRKALRTVLTRQKRTQQRVEKDLQKAESAISTGLFGESLKSQLHLIRKGMTSVDIVDYSDPELGKITVVLRPDRTPQQNLASLFTRYRKGKRGREVAGQRLAEVAATAATTENLLHQWNITRGGDKLEALLAQIESIPGFPKIAAGQAEGSRKNSTPRLPHRTFQASTGIRILVGRKGVDNHALTFQIASPHDIWLHVRGFAGSHVILPLARHQEPDRNTLLEAAHLANHYSKAPDDGFCEVIWTRRKHVHAVRKGKPGQVIHQGEKNLSFQFDPLRLKRLLANRTKSPVPGVGRD
jgi:predicted ribosome quality control (RQC) complex YloA/Tae2 family protein